MRAIVSPVASAPVPGSGVDHFAQSMQIKFKLWDQRAVHWAVVARTKAWKDQNPGGPLWQEVTFHDRLYSRIVTKHLFYVIYYRTGVSKLRPADRIRRNHFIRSASHFVNNEKIIYLRNVCWFGGM